MSSIRKIGIVLGITGLVLVMARGTSFAVAIHISEFVGGAFTDSTVEVNIECAGVACTTTPPTFTQTGVGEGTTVSSETATIIGTLTTNARPKQVTQGTYNIALMEGDPNNPTTPISDLITLIAGPTTPATGTVGPFSQTITITFKSDADPSALVFPAGGTTLILETGTVQDVSFVYDSSNTTALNLTVRSDPVPEPASLLLLGSGLVGLALWRRRHA